MTRRLSFAEALAEAIRISFEADPKVMMIWGSLFGLSPHRALANRFREDFPDRIAVPPTAEIGFCGIGIGAALAGARPIVPVGTGSFVLRALDVIAHEAGVAHYMSNGQVKAPIVFHLLHGIRGGGGAQHSLSPQAMLWNCPGLEIVMPSTPADVKGLFRRAVKSDNPTLVLDHPGLLDLEGEVPEGDYDIPFGKAEIRRAGTDVTLVGLSLQVHTALAAADILARDGISAEVLDLRTLAPLDRTALAESAAKTGRVVALDDSPLHCSVASEIAAVVGEECFGRLKAPVERVTRMATPLPFSPPLEDAVSPTVERTVAAARRCLGRP